MFVSKHVYVVNIVPAVMTLAFGASIDIHDTVRYNRTRWRSTALVRIISFSTRSKVRISLLGPRPYSFIASSYIPHRIVDIVFSPKYQSFHRRIKVNDIFMIRNIHFLNFSMVSIWAPINTSLECQNNATKCITNTKRCIPQHIHRFHNTYTFYSTTHTFHNDHPHRCHSLQLLKPYFTGKHYYFLQHYKFLQLQ